MLIRTLQDLEPLGNIRYPAGNAFRSARFLTAQDGFGFSYNENKISKTQDLTVWLKHHWEANYILDGSGEVTDLTSGEHWPLRPGTLYVVGPNDRHRLQLSAGECHLSIFHPALRGDEAFDEDGAYEASGPIPKTDRRMFVNRDGENRRIQATPLPLLTATDEVGFTLDDLQLGSGAECTLAPGAAAHIISGTGEASAAGRRAPVGPSTLVAAEAGETVSLSAQHPLHLVQIKATGP
ncbi:MAG: ectoine synthase [Pseudomonadota bacterium]